MRKKLPDILSHGRMRKGKFASDDSIGFNGMFHVDGPCGALLRIIASDGTFGPKEYRWEHVSVSTERRPPNWREMCFVKDLFWEEEECAMQLHPPKSEHINNAVNCLHMWRPLRDKIPMPPSDMVGIKDLGELAP